MFFNVLHLIPLSIISTALASHQCEPPLPYTFEIPTWQSQNFSCIGSPEVFTVGSSPGKGLGVFATRTLEPGDVILREAPVFRITPPEFRDGIGYSLHEMGALIRKEFNLLSESAKSEVLALHAYTNEAEKKALDGLVPIFRSNAYNTGTEIGLFPKIARINHSCRPSASYSWSEKLGKRVVYANRRIEEGEEIFVSYIPLLRTYEERQKRLDQYGFKCSCEACTHGRKESDRRRIDIQKAIEAFEPQMSLGVPQSKVGKKKALRNVDASLELVKLMEEEGLSDYYAKAYRIVAVSYARVENWEQAALWSVKGYGLRYMADPGSKDTREMHGLTKHMISKWNEEVRNKSMKEGASGL
ncbi:SET domain-containing protein [Corynespora cassiicola Philippines]|uniref:SET domain-containing protein n=1 Tax=Corynespora cassiicola Philippines TaxID=1448308 RepID=A0A2T2NZL9_CORCC|nr:SET domain-containing protein [Corynespora cassiicola Philippines]